MYTPSELLDAIVVTIITALGIVAWLCLFHYLIGIDPREHDAE